MKKIPSLFSRDPEDLDRYSKELNHSCEWVFDSGVVLSRKWDGAAVLVRNGELYARYDCKAGRTPPPDFEPCETAPDPVTGHWPGWVPATRPEDKWLREAFENCKNLPPNVSGRVSAFELVDGTYEAVGPKINGNPESLSVHVLMPHGNVPFGLACSPGMRDALYAIMKDFLGNNYMEGVVFTHPDGRQAKCVRWGFGLEWDGKTRKREKKR